MEGLILQNRAFSPILSISFASLEFIYLGLQSYPKACSSVILSHNLASQLVGSRNLNCKLPTFPSFLAILSASLQLCHLASQSYLQASNTFIGSRNLICKLAAFPSFLAILTASLQLSYVASQSYLQACSFFILSCNLIRNLTAMNISSCNLAIIYYCHAIFSATLQSKRKLVASLRYSYLRKARLYHACGEIAIRLRKLALVNAS